MELTFDEKTRIRTADPRNLIIEEYREVEHKGVKATRWEPTGSFYGNLKQALLALVKTKLRNSTAKTVKEIVDMINALEAKIDNLKL